MKLFLARYFLPISAAPVEDGALAVKGNRIVAAGPRAELESAFPGAEQVDFGEAILLPPCANAHTHLELTHFPQWAEKAGETASPETFVEWILQVIRVKIRLSPSVFLSSLRSGIAESLRFGTGAVGDILSHLPARAGYRGVPLRGRVYLEALGRDPALFLPRFDSILDAVRTWPEGPLRPGLSPHSPYTLCADYMEKVINTAAREELPTSTHLAESAAEVRFLVEGRGEIVDKLYSAVGWKRLVPPPAGLSPVAYLEARGGLVPWNLLVHGVHVDQDDIGRIAQSGASVVLCPRSNARVGAGKAPVALYLRAGVPLALGTDSRASCDSLSVWDELAFARRQFFGEASPGELLHAATLGGARALGLEGEMGALQPGWGAHFQILRPSVLPPLAEVEEFLCSSGCSSEVVSLFLDGRDVLQTS